MTNIYVAKTGNNSNSGTETSPLLTIQAGVAKANDGDAVYVSDGVYHEVVTINKSGIAVKKSAGQNSVVIDGMASGQMNGLPGGNWSACHGYTGANGEKCSWGGLVDITANDVVFELDVRNSNGRGIRIYGNPDTVTISSCAVYNNRLENILIYGAKSAPRPANILIYGVDIYGAGSFLPSKERYTDVCGQQVWQDHPGAISIYGSDFVTVRRCKIHNNWGQGLLCDTNWGGSTNITIEDNEYWDNWRADIYAHALKIGLIQRNVIYQSRTDKELADPIMRQALVLSAAEGAGQSGALEDIRVLNNIIFGTPFNALELRASPAAQMNNIQILNNTITNCATGLDINVQNKTGITLMNNIVTACGVDISSATNTSNVTADNNYWDSVPGKFSGVHDVIDNVSLVDALHNPAAGEHDTTNFRLLDSSSVIGAGADLTAEFGDADTVDYFGVKRVDSWGIGAAEYVDAPPPPPPPPVEPETFPITGTMTIYEDGRYEIGFERIA